MINIQGLLKTTLLDYPGCVASTVFLGGCNMRCPFCHNMNIVTSDNKGSYTDEDVLRFLSKRTGIIDGVCITGGEPTLCPELPGFITSIKNMGFKVKLDTNGTNPDMVSRLIDDSLIDIVAMDIKSSFSDYGKACGVKDIKLIPIENTIDILKKGIVEYEFRTTAVKELLDEKTVLEIGQMLQGADKYFLQGFVMSDAVPDRSLHPLPKETLLIYREMLLKYISHVELRGIDLDCVSFEFPAYFM